MPVNLKFDHSCINCEKINTDDRNLKGLPCIKCLPNETNDYINSLITTNKLYKLEKYIRFENEFKDFFNFFVEKTGLKLNGYQKLWTKRVLLSKSFTMIAPTGLGKTTFGILMAIWLAKKEKKSILIFPTITIVKQVVEKIKKLDKTIKVLYYNSNMKKSEKEDFEKRFKKDDYKILIVSTQFISKRKEELKNKFFDFVFIDDVDSVLKSSKNIETIIMLTGVPENIINETLKKLKSGQKPEIKDLKKGILVVSSATARPKGIRPLLFRYIFNFNLGKPSFFSRNIIHIRYKNKEINQLIELLKILNDGIIIYAENENEAKKLKEALKKNNIEAGTSWENFEESFEKFKNGKLNILIGISSYYGKLVRGIDLPEKIKAVIFWGIPKFRIEKEDLILPDIYTYVQATGRTSRLFKGNLLKGASFVFEENDEIFEKLSSRLFWITDEEFYNYNDIDIKKLANELNESRKNIQNKELEFSSKLIIVESPTKAETLAKFFGISSIRSLNGLISFESITKEGLITITATKGHTYDLITREGYHGVEFSNNTFIPIYNTIKKCKDCGYQFVDNYDKCPKCNSKNIDDKLSVLKALRELSLEVDEILIASDPDVEGEKIAYDILQYIYPVNSNIKRIELHEITRNAFLKGIDEKREIKENLVKSQIIRRIEDRWIGFELSQKLQTNFKRTLSAGRVQSTVLGWIIQREKEYKNSIKKFTSFTFENGLKVEFEGIHENATLKIENIYEDTIAPPAPFNTSTILSEISKKYKLSVNEIMSILQNLFENGFITYHRTDSTRISKTGQAVAEKYFKLINKPHLYKPKSYGNEGAHEGIRPVKPISPEELKDMIKEKIINLDKKHLLIYKEIFNRFLASQSKEIKVKKARLNIITENSKKSEEIITEILEDGWNIFMPIKVIQIMDENKVTDRKVYNKHTVPLFTQATIIEEMKSKNIGRPSTYAKIISVLFERKYIFEDKYKRIIPTKLGKIVYNFLNSKYNKFINEETTRTLEKIMDEVEKGIKEFQQTLHEIYNEIKGGIKWKK